MPVGEDDRATNRNINATVRSTNVNLTKAAMHRALADNQQGAMREAISHNRKLTPSSSRISPSGENDGKGLPSGRKNVFKSLVGVLWSGIENIKLFSATLRILMYPLKGERPYFGARMIGIKI